MGPIMGQKMIRLHMALQNLSQYWFTQRSILCLTYCGWVMLYGVSLSGILVNSGSGYGLLPDGTKPLPELMLKNHQSGRVAINIHLNLSLLWAWKLSIQDTSHISPGQVMKACATGIKIQSNFLIVIFLQNMQQGHSIASSGFLCHVLCSA